jgi:hypothetical protein
MVRIAPAADLACVGLTLRRLVLRAACFATRVLLLCSDAVVFEPARAEASW